MPKSPPRKWPWWLGKMTASVPSCSAMASAARWVISLSDSAPATSTIWVDPACSFEKALNARREASMGAQHLAQRAHELPLDHVGEDAGNRVLPVEELLERIARQDEQEGPLPSNRGDRRWATVNEARSDGDDHARLVDRHRARPTRRCRDNRERHRDVQ